VASFEPLGFKQNEMELEHLREHVESRICSTFGVPPIIVGALVGLKRATYSNYERAEQSFWSETMVPWTQAVRAALQRELLSEFATRADEGAEVAFDFSGVRALEENLSAKLREAARLINTGGYSRNHAHRLLGLEELPDGDFYIRAANQMAVPVGAVSPATGTRTRKQVIRDDDGRIAAIIEAPELEHAEA